MITQKLKPAEAGPIKRNEQSIELHRRALQLEQEVAAGLGLPWAPRQETDRKAERTLLGLQMELRRVQDPDLRRKIRQADELRWGLALTVDPLATRLARGQEDRLQAAREGAYRAALIWDPERSSLPTHAAWWIRAALQRYRQDNVMRFSGAEAESMRNVETVVASMSARGLSPDTAHIAREVGLSPDRVRFLQQRQALPLSLDGAVLGAEGVSLIETLEAPDRSPEDQAILALDGERIRSAICDLDPRQKALIESYYGGDETLHTLGHRLGISRERARQIKEQGLRHLRRGIGL